MTAPSTFDRITAHDDQARRDSQSAAPAARSRLAQYARWKAQETDNALADFTASFNSAADDNERLAICNNFSRSFFGISTNDGSIFRPVYLDGKTLLRHEPFAAQESQEYFNTLSTLARTRDWRKISTDRYRQVREMLDRRDEKGNFSRADLDELARLGDIPKTEDNPNYVSATYSITGTQISPGSGSAVRNRSQEAIDADARRYAEHVLNEDFLASYRALRPFLSGNGEAILRETLESGRVPTDPASLARLREELVDFDKSDPVQARRAQALATLLESAKASPEYKPWTDAANAFGSTFWGIGEGAGRFIGELIAESEAQEEARETLQLEMLNRSPNYGYGRHYQMAKDKLGYNDDQAYEYALDKRFKELVSARYNREANNAERKKSLLLDLYSAPAEFEYDYLERSLIGAAGSAGYMTALAVPYAGVAANVMSHYEEMGDKILLDGGDPDQNRALRFAGAVGWAFMEQVQKEWFFDKPLTSIEREALMQQGVSGFIQLAKHSGKEFVAEELFETMQEGAQGVVEKIELSLGGGNTRISSRDLVNTFFAEMRESAGAMGLTALVAAPAKSGVQFASGKRNRLDFDSFNRYIESLGNADGVLTAHAVADAERSESPQARSQRAAAMAKIRAIWDKHPSDPRAALDEIQNTYGLSAQETDTIAEYLYLRSAGLSQAARVNDPSARVNDAALLHAFPIGTGHHLDPEAFYSYAIPGATVERITPSAPTPNPDTQEHIADTEYRQELLKDAQYRVTLPNGVSYIVRYDHSAPDVDSQSFAISVSHAMENSGLAVSALSAEDFAKLPLEERLNFAVTIEQFEKGFNHDEKVLYCSRHGLGTGGYEQILDERGRVLLDATAIINLKSAADFLAHPSSNHTLAHEHSHIISQVVRNSGSLTPDDIAVMQALFGKPRTSSELWDEERVGDNIGQFLHDTLDYHALAGLERPVVEGVLSKIWRTVKDFLHISGQTVPDTPHEQSLRERALAAAYNAVLTGDFSGLRQFAGKDLGPAVETPKTPEAPKAPAETSPAPTPKADTEPPEENPDLIVEDIEDTPDNAPEQPPAETAPEAPEPPATETPETAEAAEAVQAQALADALALIQADPARYLQNLPVRSGIPTKVVDPKSQIELDTEWMWISLDQAQADTANERNRSGANTSAQVLNTTRRGTFAPVQFLTHSYVSDRGAPIVGNGLSVVSGNGRILMLKSLRDQGRYQDYLSPVAAWAAQNGLPPPPDGMEHPVLVRRIVSDVTPARLQRFKENSNRSAMAEFTEAEDAAKDAKFLTPSLLSLFRPGKGANLLAASNREFMDGFIKAVGADNSLRDTKGRPTARAALRVENAILGKLLGTVKPDGSLDQEAINLVDLLVSDREGLGLADFKHAILSSAGQISALSATGKADYDISPHLKTAVAQYVAWKADGAPGSFRNYLSQSDLFRGELPLVVQNLAALAESGRLATALARYAELAAQQDSDEQGLFDFGDAATAKTPPADLLAQADRDTLPPSESPVTSAAGDNARFSLSAPGAADWGDEERSVAVVKRAAPPWRFVKGKTTKEAKAEIKILAKANIAAQPNYAALPNDETPALRLDGVIFKIPLHNLFHAAGRRLKHTGAAAAAIGDIVNASVEVPGVNAPWHYRIAALDFGAKSFALITAKTTGKTAEVVEMQTFQSVNVKTGDIARELNHTNATRPNAVSIAELKAAWQEFFEGNLKKHNESAHGKGGNEQALDAAYPVSAPDGAQKDAHTRYPDAAAEIASTRFSIGKKRKAEYTQLIAKHRPDLDAAAIVDEIEKFNDTKLETAALHWTIRGSLLLPQDAYKVREAVDTAVRAKADPLKWANPNELLEELKDFKPKEKPIDPDTVPELSGKRDMDGGVVTYLVRNDRQGQLAMRRIIDTHWGEDANPWCLLARNKDEEPSLQALKEWWWRNRNGRPHSDNYETLLGYWRKENSFAGLDTAWEYWGNYSALPKRVAFKNGKLLAFCASEHRYAEWWDRLDTSHRGEEGLMEIGKLDEAKAMEKDGAGREVRYSISGLYTGSAADYANRDEQGNIVNGPSLHHVGTGEGAQVYGWGLYASNRRGIAEGYAKADLSRKDSERLDKYMADTKWGRTKKVVFNGERPEINSPLEIGLSYLQSMEMTIDDLIYEFRNRNKAAKRSRSLSAQDKAKYIAHHESIIRALDENRHLIEAPFAPRPRKHIYEQTFFTDRPEGDESHLLNWYEPVTKEQKERIKAQAEKEGLNVSNLLWDGGEIQGAMLYNYLATPSYLGSPQAASEFLARAGIDGVKYPVNSFGKTVKDGDKVGWNYVSFRDDNIRVDHKWTDGVQRFSIVSTLRTGLESRTSYTDAHGKRRILEVVKGNRRYGRDKYAYKHCVDFGTAWTGGFTLDEIERYEQRILNEGDKHFDDKTGRRTFKWKSPEGVTFTIGTFITGNGRNRREVINTVYTDRNYKETKMLGTHSAQAQARRGQPSKNTLPNSPAEVKPESAQTASQGLPGETRAEVKRRPTPGMSRSDVLSAFFAQQLLAGKKVKPDEVANLVRAMGITDRTAAEISAAAQELADKNRQRLSNAAASSDPALLETLARQALDERYRRTLDNALSTGARSASPSIARRVERAIHENRARQLRTARGYAASEMMGEFGLPLAFAVHQAALVASTEANTPSDFREAARAVEEEIARLDDPAAPAISPETAAKLEALRKHLEHARAVLAIRKGESPDIDESAAPAIEQAAAALADPAVFATALVEWTARKIRERYPDIAAAADIWKNPVAVKTVRETAVSFLRSFATSLLGQPKNNYLRNKVDHYINTLETATTYNQIAKGTERIYGHILSAVRAIHKHFNLEAAAAERHRQLMDERLRRRILQRIRNGWREKDPATGKMITHPGLRKVAPDARISATDEDLQRKVTARVQVWARLVDKYINLTPEAVEDERARLEEVIAREGGSAPADSEADAPVTQAYHDATEALAVLDRYGALARTATTGELMDTLREITAQLEGERDAHELRREMRDRELEADRQTLIAALSDIDPAAAPRKTSRLLRSVSGIARSLNGNLYSEMRSLLRYCRSPELRQAAARIIQKYEIALANATTAARAFRVRRQRELNEILTSIYGSAREGINHLCDALPAEIETAEVEWDTTDPDTGEPVHHKRRLFSQDKSPNRAPHTYANLLALYAATIQQNYAENAALHGRTAALALMEQALTPQDLEFHAAAVGLLNRVRPELSAVVERVTGLPVLAPNANYFPVRPHTPSRSGLGTGAVDVWNPVSRALSRRIPHSYDFDERTDFFSLLSETIATTARTIGYAETGMDLRDVFGHSSVATTAREYLGGGELNGVLAHIRDVLNEGAAPYKDREFCAPLLAMRKFITFSALGFNISSAIGQLASMPVWANTLINGKAIGVKRCIHYLSHPDRATVKMLVESDWAIARWGFGHSDEIAAALSSPGKGRIRELYNRIGELSLTPNKFFDMVSVLAMAQGFYRDARDAFLANGASPGEAHSAALGLTTAAAESYQQSSRVEMQNSLQRQHGGKGEFYRIAFQFRTAQLLQNNQIIEAVRDLAAGGAAAQDAKARLARAIIINAFYVPLFYAIVKSLSTLICGDFPPDDEWGRKWLSNLAMSCVDGVTSPLFWFNSIIHASVSGLTGDGWRNSLNLPAFESAIKFAADGSRLIVDAGQAGLATLNIFDFEDAVTGDQLKREAWRFAEDFFGTPARYLHRATRDGYLAD